MKTINSKKLLANGFMRCGLSPFDVEAVDFSKIIKNNDCTSQGEVCITDSSVMNENSFKNLENLIHADKLELFYLNETAEWKGPIEDKSLFEIWYELKHEHCPRSEVNLI